MKISVNNGGKLLDEYQKGEVPFTIFTSISETERAFKHHNFPISPIGYVFMHEDVVLFRMTVDELSERIKRYKTKKAQQEQPSATARPFASQYEKYRFSQSTEATSEDIPLDFKVEKVEWNSLPNLVVWGSIKNAGSRSHRFVKVTLTAKDAYGKTLAREDTYADPSDIGPGQVGNTKLYLDLEEEPSNSHYDDCLSRGTGEDYR